MESSGLPKVSIVCVTKNAAEYIAACIESILKQIYENIEIVIFDAVSTDGTQDILASYGDKITYWKSEPDSGIYHAMNKALKHVTGEWIYFVGADDTLRPEFSSFLFHELKDRHCIYYANVIYKGEKTKGEVSPYEQAKHGIFHQTIVYPASVFQKYKYDPLYSVSADYALNMKLYGDKSYKFVYKDYTIANYNDNGLSSYYIDENFLRVKEMYILKYFDCPVKLRFLFRSLKSKLKGKEKKDI